MRLTSVVTMIPLRCDRFLSRRDEGRRRCPAREVLGDPVPHEDARLPGAFLPGEDAGGHGAVEAGRLEAGEELAEVHLALADVEVLVHPDGRAGRVDDVAQTRRPGVVEGVR